ncbi:hypothetical protein DJ74_16200, partial [Halorubrum sp. Ea8]
AGGSGGTSAGDRARGTGTGSAAGGGDGGKLTDWVDGEPGAEDEGETDEARDRRASERGDGQASLGDWG